jgi:hypothetical protein
MDMSFGIVAAAIVMDEEGFTATCSRSSVFSTVLLTFILEEPFYQTKASLSCDLNLMEADHSRQF